MTKGPLVVGLTGSIGMGKSTVARMFERKHIPVFCADRCVHELLGPEGIGTRKLSRLFPTCISKRGVNRQKLADLLFKDEKRIKQVEAILHPLVWKARERFFNQARKAKAPFVVFDIPLLFETGAEKACDITLCVSANKEVQKERVLKRKGMTEKKFRAILKRQMSDAQKRKRADIVIKTDVDLAETRADVKKIIAFLIEETGRHA